MRVRAIDLTWSRIRRVTAGPTVARKDPTSPAFYTIKKRNRQKENASNTVKDYATADVGQIRTDAPEGTRFLVLRDNHSATTPLIG
jgi:hypothetical protein